MLFRRPALAAVILALVAAPPSQAFAPRTVGRAAVQPSAPMRVPAPAPAVLKQRDGVWAQDYVGRAADPAVRFGRLSNGMRYAVMRNDSPKGVTSLRLRVGAGSLDEADDQAGLAHFLEHMAFKGSKQVPGDTLIKTLERMGLAFGADTNASTGFDETIYKLDLPQSTPETLATGLMLLREQASELTLAQSAMDPERGVVLSEERLRDTPGYQAMTRQIGFLLDGQRAPTRFPIGDVKVLQTAPVSRIRAFYEAHYRPELTTLVVVGDVDPAAMEAQIKARFSDWKAKGPAPAPVDRGAVKPRGAQVRLFVRDGAAPTVRIAWVAPYDDAADTFAHARTDFVQQLGLAVLTRRLSLLGASAEPPFLAAGASKRSLVRSAEVTSLDVSPRGLDWRGALTAAIAEQRRISRYGVSQTELDREVTEVRGALIGAAAGAATRRSPQIADSVVQSVGDNSVVTSPAQDLAEFEQVVKGLTAAEVSAAVRGVFAGAGPLVFITAPQPIEGGEAAVAQALRAAQAAPVAPQAVQATLKWPYERLGVPATVTARREVADLGVTFATLSNGVQVTVKPTDFRKDQVLVQARFGQGRLGLPMDRANAAWAASSSFVQGGTRELTFEEIDRVGAGRLASAQLGQTDDAWVLSGTTRPADLPFEMQLLAAYLSRPGFRPEAFARTKTAALSMLDQIDATPSGVLSRDFGVLSHSGDPRWSALPDRKGVEAVTLDAVRSAIDLPPGGAPREVVIVGDVTVDRALELAAQTFGALPPVAAAPAPSAAALTARFPAPGQVERLHRGRADQAVALVAWPTADLMSDPQRARALGMASDILQLRLTDEIRNAEGASYSPGSTSTNSEVFPGYGFIYAQVETPPDKIARFFAETDRIAASLGATGPTPDEMERAKRPRVEQRIKTQQTDEYWVSVLARAADDPRQLQLIRDLVPGNRKVSAADVQAVAAEYLKPARAWRLVVRAPAPVAGGAAQTPLAPAAPPQPPTVEPTPPPPASGSKTATSETQGEAAPAASPTRQLAPP